MIKVKVLNAKTLGKINEINLDLVTSVNNEYIVGRSPQSGLILDSSDVSRMHGKFFVQNGNYYYSDLGSVNGSLVNDKLAENNQIYQLKSRDVIRIGEFLLVIEEVDEEPEAMPVTVFNPNWQPASLKVDPPVITNQPLEPVSEVPTPANQHLEPVNEVPAVVTNESEHLIPVDEELNQSPDLTIIQIPKDAIASEINLQTEEAAIASTEVDSPRLSDIYESEPTVIQKEVTIIQLPEEVAIEVNTSTPGAPASTEVVETREIDSEIPSNTNESEATVIQGEITVPQQVALEENTPTPGSPALTEVVEATDDTTVIHEEVTVIQLPQQVALEENTPTLGAPALTEVVEATEIDTHESDTTVIHEELTVIQLPQQVALEENTPTLGAPALTEVVEATDDTTVIHEEVTILEQVALEENTPTLGDPALTEVVEATDDATVIHEEVTILEQVAAEENTPTLGYPALTEVVEVTDDTTMSHEEVTVLEQVTTEENTPTSSASALSEVVETREIDTHKSDANVIQGEVTIIQIPELVETEEINTQTEDPLALNEVQASENNTQTSLDINEVLEEIVDKTEEVEASAVIPETTTPSTEVVEASTAIFDEVATRDQPTTDTVSQTTIESPESVTQAPEEVSQDITEAFDEAKESEVMAQTPETVNKAFEIIGKKYIALMTHDSKKSELVQFVTRHQDFLLKCLTIATPSISETLSQQTRLTTSQKTPSVPVGGYQAVASLIGTGDVLAVILLKDFLSSQSNQANEEALLRLCNINQILVATNLPTADAIIHYIKDMVTSL